jgi:hypothetical protein
MLKEILEKEIRSLRIQILERDLSIMELKNENQELYERYMELKDKYAGKCLRICDLETQLDEKK